METTHIPPSYLSIRSAVVYSGVNRTRLFALLAQGRITAKKAGRQSLVERASLDAYLTNLPAWKGNAAA